MSDVEVLDPRHDPEPPYWEVLRLRAGLRADWSYDLLRAAAWCASAPLFVTVLRDGDEVVGVVCASFAGVPARNEFSRGRPWLGALFVESPGTSALPGWWFDPRLSTQDRTGWCRRYLQAMRRELGPRCRGVVWRHAEAADLPVLRSRRATLLRDTDAIAVLPLSFPDLDGWLAGLGQSRRSDLRRQRRIVEADPDVVVSLGPAAADPAQLAALLRWTESKYADRHAGLPLATSYLATLVARTDVQTVTYTDHTGRLLAFSVTLDHPRAPVPRLWAALPPELGGRRHLYFDLYTRLVEWATGAGRVELNLGRAKLELKQTLGCELQPRHSVAAPCW